MVATRRRKTTKRKRTTPETPPIIIERPLIRLPSFTLPKRKPKAPTDPKPMMKREELWIVHDRYQPGYDVFDPRRRDLEPLDIRGRYVRRRSAWRWGLIPLGILTGVGVAFIPLAFLAVLGMVPVWWFFVLLMGGLLGAQGGWLMAVRMFPNEARWFFEYNGDMTPIFPLPMLQSHQMKDDKNRPMIMRGTLMKSIASQPFVRRWLRITRRSSKARQMNLTGILLFSGAMVALLIFFAIANSGP